MINVVRFLLIIVLIYCSTIYGKSVLSFQDCLKITKENNLNLKAELQKIRIAKADVLTARILPNPELNSQELFRAKPKSGDSFYSGSNRQDWLQITQKIPVAGQRTNAIYLAERNLQLSQENLLEFERNLLFITANKWLDVWISSKVLDSIQRAKGDIHKLLQLNQVRLKNQVITQTEYLRTENLYKQYEINYYSAEQQYKNEIRNLSFYLAMNEPPNLDIDANFPFLSLSIEEEPLTKYALENRPDIKINISNKQIAIASLNLAESLSVPRPEVGFIYNPQNNDRYYGSFVTIPLPIFDRNQGNILRQKEEILKSQYEIEAIEKQIMIEVKNSIGQYKIDKENFERAKKIYLSAEKILETVQYSYLKGGTTIIDYFDAQRNWFDVLNLYYTSIYSYRKSYIQLLYVTNQIQRYLE
jgi:cobalt-zinc-cadmium efflux system outer membrane protein